MFPLETLLKVTVPLHPGSRPDIKPTIFFYCAFGQTLTETPDTPNGWTKKYEYTRTSYAKFTLFWKRCAASSGESAPSIPDVGNTIVAQILCYRGCLASGDPFDVAAEATDSGTNQTSPTITTTVNNAMVFSCCASPGPRTASGWSNANLVSLTERVDIKTTYGSDGSLHIASGTKAAAGATGTTAYVLDSSGYTKSVTFSIKPQTTYSLSATGGSFTVSGTPTTEILNIHDATQAVTMDGVNVRSHNMLLTVGPGTFTVTGTAASLFRSLALAASSGIFTLTGTVAGLGIGYVLRCDPGSLTLTGPTVSLAISYANGCSSGSFTLTETAASLLRSSIVSASSGTFTLAGTDVTFHYTVIKVLDASSGSFTVTGIAAGVLWSRVVSSSSGAFTLTGTSATFARSWCLDAREGSFELTGTAAALLGSYSLEASPGTCTYTGTAADLLGQNALSCESGTYTSSGTDAGLYRWFTLGAESDSFAFTGTTAELLKSSVVGTSFGSFAFTGTTATLAQSTVVDASSGAYTINGADVTFQYTVSLHNLEAGPGTYIFTGTAADFFRSLVVSASSCDFTLTGTAADLLRSLILGASPGELTYGAPGAEFLKSSLVDASSGEFAITGTAAGVYRSTDLEASPGELGVTGTAAGLLRSSSIAAFSGEFMVTGAAAGFVFQSRLETVAGEFAIEGTDADVLHHRTLYADPDIVSGDITRYVADSGMGAFQGSVTFGINITANLPNDIIIMSVALDGRASVSSIVLGGRSFEKLASITGAAAGYNRAELWYMVNPPKGLSTYTMNVETGGWSAWVVVRTDHYYNVNQDDPFGDVANNFASAAYNISTQIEDIQPDQFPFDWVVHSVAWMALTHGADQTLIGQSGFGNIRTGISHRYGDTEDLPFAWSAASNAGNFTHLVTALKPVSTEKKNRFSITGTPATFDIEFCLTIHDANHGVTMAAPVLVVPGSYTLVIDDCLHEITMDGAAIVMPVSLDIHDALHAITMDNVVIPLPATLDIHDAIHAMTMQHVGLNGFNYSNVTIKINIGGTWKPVSGMKLMIDEEWKAVTGVTLRQ